MAAISGVVLQIARIQPLISRRNSLAPPLRTRLQFLHHSSVLFNKNGPLPLLLTSTPPPSSTYNGGAVPVVEESLINVLCRIVVWFYALKMMQEFRFRNVVVGAISAFVLDSGIRKICRLVAKIDAKMENERLQSEIEKGELKRSIAKLQEEILQFKKEMRHKEKMDLWKF